MVEHTPRLLDAFDDGIYIINEDYTVGYMNKFMKEIFGEGEGKKCHKVLIGSDKPCNWCNYDKIFIEDETTYSQVYLESVGKTFALKEIPVKNQDGTKSKLSVYHDISFRVQQENQIKKAHDFLDQIISCSPNAIMAMDMKGVIKLWNQSAEDIFRYKSVQVVEKMTIQQIFSHEVSQKAMEKIRDEKSGGRGRLNSYPLNFKRDDGELVEGNFSASIIYDEKGEEMVTVGVFVDLKERLQSERDLSSARQHLLQSEKLAAMGRLTSQIAHEMNNPLFGIMNTLELMKSEVSPKNKRRKLLDMSLSEVERLADMLKKMLSFSKPDQDKRLRVDINVIIEELIMLYEKRFRENSIKTKLDLAEKPGDIFASRDQLRQVFINMFSNAMYAMPEGGSLEISTQSVSDKLHITIKDTGFGIKPEHIEKVFDSFFTTKTENVQGVGLGLSVCYGFIRDHDGDIVVESEPGQWTKFTITLPFVKYYSYYI